MSGDPRFGPTQEESSEPKTLGQILFPESDSSDMQGFTLQANKFLDDRIRTTDDRAAMEEAIFILKLDSYISPIRYKVLETIFKCLPKNHSELREKETLMRMYRERLGKIALEVFFEKVFGEDKGFLWRYFSSPESYSWSDNKIEPTSIYVLLDYFARCNEATKIDHRGNIRKFLKCILNDPLVFHTNENRMVTISEWKSQGRLKLADALVANGMYEECLDYNLPEAYRPLVLKFLGNGFVEGDAGLIILDKFTNESLPEEAMERACNDKEWAHIWSAITRMAYKHGVATITRTTDPNDPRIARGHTNVSLKLAFVFENGLKSGLDGF